jgi:hypothetical protein
VLSCLTAPGQVRLRSEGSELTWRFRVAEGGLMMSGGGEQPDGVSLTNLDQPLFDGADATKRDLVDYLDAVADHIICCDLRCLRLTRRSSGWFLIQHEESRYGICRCRSSILAPPAAGPW